MSLIHFVIVIVYEVRQGSNVPLLHVYVQLFQYHLLKKTIEFPIKLSWPLCWKSVDRKCKNLFLDSQFHSTDSIRRK